MDRHFKKQTTLIRTIFCIFCVCIMNAFIVNNMADPKMSITSKRANIIQLFYKLKFTFIKSFSLLCLLCLLYLTKFISELALL